MPTKRWPRNTLDATGAGQVFRPTAKACRKFLKLSTCVFVTAELAAVAGVHFCFAAFCGSDAVLGDDCFMLLCLPIFVVVLLHLAMFVDVLVLLRLPWSWSWSRSSMLPLLLVVCRFCSVVVAVVPVAIVSAIVNAVVVVVTSLYQ